MKIKHKRDRKRSTPIASYKSSITSTNSRSVSAINWRAPLYHQYEKSIWWFVVAAFIAAALIFYGLSTDGGWTFSVAILVFCGVYYLIHRHTPPKVEVKISEMGIKIGTRIFHYNHLKYFWIVYDPPFVKRLYLRHSARFYPDIHISIEDEDPAEVRRILKKFISEAEGIHEPFVDTLVRIFKL